MCRLTNDEYVLITMYSSVFLEISYLHYFFFSHAKHYYHLHFEKERITPLKTDKDFSSIPGCLYYQTLTSNSPIRVRKSSVTI